MSWNEPHQVDLVPKPTSPSERHKVRVLVDYGSGSIEVPGRMYRVDDAKPMLVFADEGGWCTQYVTGWKFK